MGLITFVLLSAFTLLYVSSAVPKSIKFANHALVVIKQHINYLAIAGVVYGFAALVVTPFLSGSDLLIRLLANFLLILMALPYIFERSVAQYEAKINAAILKEFRAMISSISRHEKLIGTMGVVSSVLLFATVF